MTDEEIRKLAEQYVKEVHYDDFFLDEATRVIKWLSDKFCIVEKEKVIRLWNEIIDDAKTNIANGFPDYAEFNKLQLPPLEILFGKELFNDTEK